MRLFLATLLVTVSAYGCANANAAPPAMPMDHDHMSMAAGPVSDHANRKTKAYGEQYWWMNR